MQPLGHIQISVPRLCGPNVDCAASMALRLLYNRFRSEEPTSLGTTAQQVMDVMEILFWAAIMLLMEAILEWELIVTASTN